MCLNKLTELLEPVVFILAIIEVIDRSKDLTSLPPTTPLSSAVHPYPPDLGPYFFLPLSAGLSYAGREQSTNNHL